MGEKRIFLENSVELPFIRCKGCNVLSIENYFSGVRIFESAEDTQKRCLSAVPLGPKKCEKFIFSDIKVQVVQNQIVSI